MATEKLCGNVVASIFAHKSEELTIQRVMQHRKTRKYLYSLDQGYAQDRINELTQKYKQG